MRPLSSSTSFDSTLLRRLDTAPYNGADVAEALDVAERMVKQRPTMKGDFR